MMKVSYQEEKEIDWLLNNKGLYNNIVFASRISGDLDEDRLSKAISIVARQNQCFSTKYVCRETASGHNIERSVSNECRLELDMMDADPSALTDTTVMMRGVLGQRFDPQNGPLGRLRLIRLGHQDFRLIGCIAHLVFDGYSIGVFKDKLAQAYKGMTASYDGSLSAFAEEQRVMFDARTDCVAFQYWRQLFRDVSDQIDTGRVAEFSPRIDDYIAEDASLTFKPTQSPGDDGRWNAGFYKGLASYAKTVAGMLGRRSVLIGVNYANRGDPKYRESIGFFSTHMPMLIDVDQLSDWSNTFRYLHDLWTRGLLHAHVPPLVMDDLATVEGRKISYAAFMYNYAPTGRRKDTSWLSDNLAIREEFIEYKRTSKNALMCIHTNVGDREKLIFRYNPNVFDRLEMEGYLADFALSLKA